MWPHWAAFYVHSSLLLCLLLCTLCPLSQQLQMPESHPASLARWKSVACASQLTATFCSKVRRTPSAGKMKPWLGGNHLFMVPGTRRSSFLPKGLLQRPLALLVGHRTSRQWPKRRWLERSATLEAFPCVVQLGSTVCMEQSVLTKGLSTCTCYGFLICTARFSLSLSAAWPDSLRFVAHKSAFVWCSDCLRTGRTHSCKSDIFTISVPGGAHTLESSGQRFRRVRGSVSLTARNGGAYTAVRAVSSEAPRIHSFVGVGPEKHASVVCRCRAEGSLAFSTCRASYNALTSENASPEQSDDTRSSTKKKGNRKCQLDFSKLPAHEDASRRFVVVDGSCVMFRCFHAVPSMTNRNGEEVGAVVGFYRSLLQIRRLCEPDFLVVVFDHPTGRLSRLAICEDYKRHRKQMPSQLVLQLHKAKALCSAMGLCTLEVEGVEGDDVIATLVHRLCIGKQSRRDRSIEEGQDQLDYDASEIDQIIVATVDKDLLQLLRYNYANKNEGLLKAPSVRLMHLHRQCRMVDDDFVRQHYGVEPHQLLDLFALVGDRADGISGCKGIGFAAAKKVLNAFDGLEEVLKNPEELKGHLSPRQYSLVSSFFPSWQKNRHLVCLDCNVGPALSQSLSDFRVKAPQVHTFRQIAASCNLHKQADTWLQLQHPKIREADAKTGDEENPSTGYSTGKSSIISEKEAVAEPIAGSTVDLIDLKCGSTSATDEGHQAVAFNQKERYQSPGRFPPLFSENYETWQDRKICNDKRKVSSGRDSSDFGEGARGSGCCWPSLRGLFSCLWSLGSQPGQSLMQMAHAVPVRVAFASSRAPRASLSNNEETTFVRRASLQRFRSWGGGRGGLSQSIMALSPAKTVGRMQSTKSPGRALCSLAHRTISDGRDFKCLRFDAAVEAKLMSGAGAFTTWSANRQRPPVSTEVRGTLHINEMSLEKHAELLLQHHQEHLTWLRQYLEQQRSLQELRESEVQRASHEAAKKLHSSRKRLASARERSLLTKRISGEETLSGRDDDRGILGTLGNSREPSTSDANSSTIPQVSPIVLTQPGSGCEQKTRVEQAAWKTSDPFVAAMALRASLAVSLEYLDLLECLSKETSAVHVPSLSDAAAAALASQLRSLPEPPSWSPLEAALFPLKFSLPSEQTPPELCGPMQCREPSDHALQRALLPVAVSWFGSKPPYPHAPMLSLQALHLTFTIRLPDGLWKAISKIWQTENSRPFYEGKELCCAPMGETRDSKETTLRTEQTAGDAWQGFGNPDLLHFHFVGEALTDSKAAMQIVSQCLQATKSSSFLAPVNAGPYVETRCQSLLGRGFSEQDGGEGEKAGIADKRLDGKTQKVPTETQGEGHAAQQLHPNVRLIQRRRPAVSRLTWAAHDAKQLFHLLKNAGLPRPHTCHFHCTAVVAWLLNGGQPRTAEFLQQTALAECSSLAEKSRNEKDADGPVGWERFSCGSSVEDCEVKLSTFEEEKKKTAAPSSSKSHQLIGSDASSPTNFVPDALQLPEVSTSARPQQVIDPLGQGLPWKVTDGKDGSCFVSPYTSLIARNLRSAEAALELHNALTRNKRKQTSTASSRTSESISILNERELGTASSRFGPWWYSEVSAGQLPPEQQHVQQGLFGRFGWGIYSRRHRCEKTSRQKSGEKQVRCCGPESQTFTSMEALPNEASGSNQLMSRGGHFAAPAALQFVPVLPEGMSAEWVLTEDKEGHPGGRAGAGECTNVSGFAATAMHASLNNQQMWQARFPSRFKKTVPPCAPEMVATADAAVFCEARGAATLDLLCRQYKTLEREQQLAEVRAAPRLMQRRDDPSVPSDVMFGTEHASQSSADFGKCLSLPWGVWVTIERPLLPVLVSIERRGLSLDLERLSQAWNIHQGACTQGASPFDSQNIPDSPDSADEGQEGERGAAGEQEMKGAPEQQRRLAEDIRKQIVALTNNSACEININSPSQLAALLYDQLALPSPQWKAGSQKQQTVTVSRESGAMYTERGPEQYTGSGIRRRTSLGLRSTSAEALQALRRSESLDSQSPRGRQIVRLIDLLLDYRASHKFVTTYYASLPQFIFPPTNRVHVSLLQMGAATGRLACRNPNLQNIPNKLEEWRWIRKAFVPSGSSVVPNDNVPRNPYSTEGASLILSASKTCHSQPTPLFTESPWRFLSVDYSQMELHILAYLSNDTQLLSDLGCIPRGSNEVEQEKRSPRFDTFQMTASRLFSCEPCQVTRELRSVAKTVTYGILYGQTEAGLSRKLDLPLAEARRLIHCFFAEYPAVQTLTRMHTDFAQSTGSIETLVGRRRCLLEQTNDTVQHAKCRPAVVNMFQQLGSVMVSAVGGNECEDNVRAAQTKNRGRNRRQAMNTPIQGLAADIMKFVTARVEMLLQQQHLLAASRKDSLPDLLLTGSSPTKWVSGSDIQSKHLIDYDKLSRLFRHPLRAQLVLQIHDELLIEVHEDDIQVLLSLVIPLMEKAWGHLLVESCCLDRYAALCKVQELVKGYNTNKATVVGNVELYPQPAEQWFPLPQHYEWLRPLLQRRLPTSAKIGKDWACC